MSRCRVLPHAMAVVLAVGGVLATAGTATAATTTSCTVGTGVINTAAIAAKCTNFTPAGAPYVFDIGTLVILNFPYSPPLPQFTTYTNVVVTCQSWSPGAQGLIDGSGCNY